MADQNTYIFEGKDGTPLSFIGERPPTPQEIEQLGGVAAKPTPPTLTGLEKAAGVGPEPSMLERAVSAIAPTVRGAGDVTGANWFLEKTGIVAPGRLTGSEATARDAATRHTAAVGGLAMGAAQAVDTIGQAATTQGLSAARRAVAAAKAAGQVITPQVTYEITKLALQKAGLSSPIAFAVAAMVSGMGTPNKSGPQEPEARSIPGFPRFAESAPTVPPYVERPTGATFSQAAPPIQPYVERPTGATFSQAAPPIPPYIERPSGATLTIAAPTVPPHVTPEEYPRLTIGAAPPEAPAASAEEYPRLTIAPTPKPPAKSARSVTKAEAKTAASVLAELFGSKSDLELVREMIDRGISPLAAVKSLTGSNTKAFGDLMTSYMQSRQVK